MRTDFLLTFSLLVAAACAASDPTSAPVASGSSLEKLLDRISQRGQKNETLLVQGTHAGNGTGVHHHHAGDRNHTGPRHFKPKTKTAEAVELPSATVGGDRLVKRIKKANTDEGEVEKRWVWGTAIIQDDTPTDGLPPVGENTNMLSEGAPGANTPTANLIAPTFPAPIPVVATTPPAVAAVSSKTGRHAVSRKPKSTSAVKRWVWGNSIIQDDSPTEGLPDPGVNTDMLGSLPADTPTAVLVAPTFPPLPSDSAVESDIASPAADSVLTSVESHATPAVPRVALVRPSSSVSKPAGRAPPPIRSRHALDNVERALGPTPVLPKTSSSVSPKSSSVATVPKSSSVVAVKPTPVTPKKTKRWVWAASIIQDDTPASGLPSAGVNANLLSSDAPAVATPTTTPIAPTFNPQHVAVIPVVNVVASPSSLTPAAIVPTSTALPIRGHRAPPISHHNLAKKAKHDNLAKKWVWGTAIIQDDTPTSGLPAAGSNANLLNSLEVNTPQASLIAPTFPPLTEEVASATEDVASATVVVASVVPTKIIAPVVSSSVTVATGRAPVQRPSGISQRLPVSTANVVAALAAGNRQALSRVLHPATTTPVVKKDNIVTVDTLRRLLKEKREAAQE